MSTERLSVREALDLVRHCLEEGAIIQGAHFRKALADEAIDFEDAWAVLETGRIYDAPEVDVRTRDWKYRIEGYEPGGKWMAIVFTFKVLRGVFLITIFSIEARRRPT